MGILIIIVIAAVVIWYVYRQSPSGQASTKNQPEIETPLDIAKKRYARGEITKEEFDKIKNDL